MDFQGDALLLQRSFTVLSAGFNALYFFRYLGQMAGRSRDSNSPGVEQIPTQESRGNRPGMHQSGATGRGAGSPDGSAIRCRERTAGVGAYRRVAFTGSSICHDGAGATR